MKFRIVPYKAGSKAAKELAKALQVRVGYKVFRSMLPKPNRRNINWGSVFPAGLNPPDAVAVAKNKLKTFEKLRDTEVNIPWFTTNKEEAVALGGDLLVRQTLTGQGGAGIEDFVGQDGKLYVAYLKKKTEYRVHVFNDKVIDVQEKKRRKLAEGATPANSRIRNLANGWVFCRENVNPPDAVLQQALLAVKEVGLLWGAVDIIWNQKKELAVVLEINTAPGLTGTTINKYADAFVSLGE